MVEVGLITKLTTPSIEVAIAVAYIYRYVSYLGCTLCWTVVDCSDPTQFSAVHVMYLVISLANEAPLVSSPSLPVRGNPVVRPFYTLVVRNTFPSLAYPLS